MIRLLLVTKDVFAALTQAAEGAMGLLFAAHKNPAIGAAQALLMLLENPEHMSTVLAELYPVKTAAASATNLPLASSLMSCEALWSKDRWV